MGGSQHYGHYLACVKVTTLPPQQQDADFWIGSGPWPGVLQLCTLRILASMSFFYSAWLRVLDHWRLLEYLLEFTIITVLINVLNLICGAVWSPIAGDKWEVVPVRRWEGHWNHWGASSYSQRLPSFLYPEWCRSETQRVINSVVDLNNWCLVHSQLNWPQEIIFYHWTSNRKVNQASRAKGMPAGLLFNCKILLN